MNTLYGCVYVGIRVCVEGMHVCVLWGCVISVCVMCVLCVCIYVCVCVYYVYDSV